MKFFNTLGQRIGTTPASGVVFRASRKTSHGESIVSRNKGRVTQNPERGLLYRKHRKPPLPVPLLHSEWRRGWPQAGRGGISQFIRIDVIQKQKRGEVPQFFRLLGSCCAHRAALRTFQIIWVEREARPTTPEGGRGPRTSEMSSQKCEAEFQRIDEPGRSKHFVIRWARPTGVREAHSLMFFVGRVP